MKSDFIQSLLNKELVVNHLPKQISLFAFAGGLSMVFDLAILTICVELFRYSITVSFFIAIILSTTLNYLLSAKFIFMDGRFEKKNEIFFFIGFSLLALILHLFFMWFFNVFLTIWYLYSRILTIVIVSVFNFISRKKIIFLK